MQKTRPGIERLAELAKALGHPARVRIVQHLAERESYCGDLVDLLGLAQSTVSHHLRILREAGLVQSEAHGTATCYRVEQSGIEELDAWVSTLR